MSSDGTERTSIVLSAIDKVSIAFDLKEEDASLSTDTLLSLMREALVQRIVALLNRSPERLMAILYRIDVSEGQVNEIFSTAMPPDVPDLLADLIIERQLRKAETRRYYKS